MISREESECHCCCKICLEFCGGKQCVVFVAEQDEPVEVVNVKHMCFMPEEGRCQFNPQQMESILKNVGNELKAQQILPCLLLRCRVARE